MSEPIQPRVVTLSTLYGTGDEAIGRHVAERLGVVFVDREIPAFVAEQLNIPETAVAVYDEHQPSTLERLIDSLARAPVPSQEQPPERLDDGERQYKIEVEQFLIRTARSGGVVLGRAGAVVLHGVPGALHVRLIGPRAARVRRVMASEAMDQEAAERRVRDGDSARAAYGHKLYGVDPADDDLYHLVIDVTAFDLGTCVELIVAASDARARAATGSSPD
jgi:cytidylate kinase